MSNPDWAFQSCNLSSHLFALINFVLAVLGTVSFQFQLDSSTDKVLNDVEVEIKSSKTFILHARLVFRFVIIH